MVTLFFSQDGKRTSIRTDQDRIRFAILSDTHIPDRVDALHPALLPALSENSIDVILHCGDITRQKVVDDLSEIAPVIAVLGNRDAFFSPIKLPFTQEIEAFNQTIGMFHGFQSMASYFTDKVEFVLRGYTFEKYAQIGRSFFSSVQVICFGHTHFAEIRRYGNRIIINPGTAGPNSLNGCSSWVTLDLFKNGKRQAVLNALEGYQCHFHHWQKEKV